MNFSKLTISTRLSVCFGLLTALLFAVVAVATLQLGQMRAVTHEIASNWMPKIEVIDKLNDDALRVRVKEFRHIMVADETRMTDVERETGEVMATFRRDE